ncbi:MAG: TIGR04086 family membrane protein [Clostridium sp.]
MGKSNLRIMIRTIFITYILTAVLLLILAFSLYRFHLNENQINMGVNFIYVAVCLFGGLLAGKAAKRKRLIWGSLTGALYVLILFVISVLIHKGIGSSAKELMLIFAMCAGSGAIGGMIS